MDVCPPPGGTWYLPEPPSPPGTPAPPFFMDYEVESGAVAAPGLLGYSEDAENEDFLPPTDVLQVSLWGPGIQPAPTPSTALAHQTPFPYNTWERTQASGLLASLAVTYQSPLAP